MRNHVFAAVLACTLAFSAATAAIAKEFQLPDANPAVSVTLPDAWKPEELATGTQATSPDGEAFIMVETGTSRSVEALIKENFEFLKTNKVVLDTSTQKQQPVTIAGMSGTAFRWMGKDDDGPTAVTMFIVGVTDNLALVVTAWASPAAEKKYESVLDGVMNSIRKL